MSDLKFKVFPGTFMCQKCKIDVKSLRLWIESGDATWMCENKHLSRVGLIPQKKKKKDFDSE